MCILMQLRSCPISKHTIYFIFSPRPLSGDYFLIPKWILSSITTCWTLVHPLKFSSDSAVYGAFPYLNHQEWMNGYPLSEFLFGLIWVLSRPLLRICTVSQVVVVISPGFGERWIFCQCSPSLLFMESLGQEGRGFFCSFCHPILPRLSRLVSCAWHIIPLLLSNP